MANFVESLEEAFALRGIEVGRPMMEPFTLEQTEEAIEVLNNSWKPVHEMLLFILRESNNEFQIQQVFYNVQSLIRLAGTANNNYALQTLLERLCDYRLPPNIADLDWEQSFKCILASNSIVGTARSLHGVLKKPEWGCVFHALVKINEAVYRNKEGLLRKQLESLHYGQMRKKLSENFALHFKDFPCGQEKMLAENLELSAGTGEIATPLAARPVQAEDSASLPCEEIKDEFVVRKNSASSRTMDKIGVNMYKTVSGAAIPEKLESDKRDIREETKSLSYSLDLLKSVDALPVFTVLFDVQFAIR